MTKERAKSWSLGALTFFSRHWIGTLLILVATLVFFWPMVTRISSYSEGGDAMFNAWTLARDHHCLEFQGCPKYADGNIYFPNKNSMFYSETQLSAGFFTLPLHLVNPNPIFAYNIWTIVSFFFAGWFMYILAKRLSRGNELISILAGLAFEFAPFKMAAISHLQNLSIFYLPLAVLLLVKYLDTAKKRYIVGLLATLTLLFYASWYQSVFAMFGIGAIVLVLMIAKKMNWKQLKDVAFAVGGSVLLVIPLAIQYMDFSRTSDANFSLTTQIQYSSSLADYLLPNNGTLLGKWYYAAYPGSIVNAYNVDSFSYHGVVLYLIAIAMFVGGVVLVRKARSKQQAAERKNLLIWVAAFTLVAFIGFIVSLGPVLKIDDRYTYTAMGDAIKLAIPMPWLAVDLILPQMHFIRAIGRASVLVLFGLCCMLAYVPVYLNILKVRKQMQCMVLAVIAGLIIVELMPMHRIPMSTHSYSYNLSIPEVYKRVASDPKIDNIVVLRSDPDYPGAPITIARTEDVLWAGYHNKNIFNGYSGYIPTNYFEDMTDFTNLKADDVPKMKKKGLRYVIIDKQLSKKGGLVQTARELFPKKVYEDNRYILFKI